MAEIRIRKTAKRTAQKRRPFIGGGAARRTGPNIDIGVGPSPQLIPYGDSTSSSHLSGACPLQVSSMVPGPDVAPLFP